MPNTFETLSKFITTKMRMSHVYQPVMLIELLKNSGTSTVTNIAKALLMHDVSQVEYYEHRTKIMVGKVLTNNHGITQKLKDSYHLHGFDDLSQDEINTLINLCCEKVDDYISQRGNQIWSHRQMASGYISGTVQYEVLKRAKYRCELCGVSAEIKALDVDHILPSKHGGTNDSSNLQALCYTCNRSKRDRDDTDFRGIADSYKERKAGCTFCEIEEPKIHSDNILSYAIHDQFPVTKFHSLIIPKRHVSDYFDLYQPEINSIHALLSETKVKLKELDESITGFNIGVNSGEDSGQTIHHCHVHLIPRRKGDTDNPRGGVRGVIPDKQSY